MPCSRRVPKVSDGSAVNAQRNAALLKLLSRSLVGASLLLLTLAACWHRSAVLAGEGSQATRRLQTGLLSSERVNRCREPRGTISRTYDVVLSLPHQDMQACGSVPSLDFMPSNHDIIHVSHRCLAPLCLAQLDGTPSPEVILVVPRRGPIYQLDVVTEGDYKHWTVNLPPVRQIKAQSCLDDRLFCDVLGARPLSNSFIVMDRHRVSEFDFSWEPDATENLAWHIGQMNSLSAPVSHPSSQSSLLSPTAAAVYEPLNSTHIVEGFEINATQLPHASNRFVFVVDSGNHRVLFVNTTIKRQWSIVGQFGRTGEPLQDTSGLNTPWDVAVYAPAWESLWRPVFANVFVTDRRNKRLLKLDLAYPGRGPPPLGQAPRLIYGGEFGSCGHGNESLLDPVAVVVYRHYVLVADSLANSVFILSFNDNHDALPSCAFHLVTMLRPAVGVRLGGSLAGSPLGYIWFSYVSGANEHGIGSSFLPEDLRHSLKHSRFDRFFKACHNETWYNSVLRFDRALYVSHVGYALSAMGMNWQSRNGTGFVDVFRFNRSDSFDMEAFNSSVFQGRLSPCGPAALQTSETDGRTRATALAHAVRGAKAGHVHLLSLLLFGAAASRT